MLLNRIVKKDSKQEEWIFNLNNSSNLYWGYPKNELFVLFYISFTIEGSNTETSYLRPISHAESESDVIIY